ncbi:YadA family autotransporter adhesin, partial [Rodentibacter pneumotropicus]|uniref:YadA family autotransporter adhesin n=1 Tax=Rodentibacter pneumotropicus TaxID=758 RepID=UPI0026765A30
TVKGNATFEKDTLTKGNATVNGDSLVKGNATVEGDSTVKGNATFEKDTLTKGNATVEGDSLVKGNATVEGDSTVKGNATFEKDTLTKGNATVEGDSLVKGNATIEGTTTTQDLLVNGDSTTKGNSTIGGSLTVEGNTVLQDVTINKSLTLADNAKIDLGNSDIEGSFNIYGNTDKKTLSQALDQLQMTGPLVYVDPKTNKDVQHRTDVVRLNSGSDKPVRVTNVADPKEASDAVNLGYFDKKLSLNMRDVHSRINRVDRRLRSGIASAVAMSLLPQSYRAGESVVSVGGGTYRGASAIAVGYSRVTDNGRVIIKIGGSANNSGDYAGGAAVGWKF